MKCLHTLQEATSVPRLSSSTDGTELGLLPQGPKAPPPAEARAAAAATTPRETFRVVGVSFDGRQELLAAVGAGEKPSCNRLDTSMKNRLGGKI